MSDDLDRAIDAGIDAHRPASIPPFDAIIARGRRRDRGRMIAAAAAVALVAVTTAALALPDSQGQRSERLAGEPPVSEPVPPAWDGRSGPLAEEGITRASCVETYSPTSLVNRAFAFDGTVSEIGASVTNRAGKGQLELAGVTFTVNTWYRGGEQDTIAVDLPRPVPAGSAVGQTGPSYEVGSRLLVSGEPRWGGAPLDQPIAWTACGGFTRYYDPETAEIWRGAFAAQNSPDSLRLTSEGVRGATLCLADTNGGYADSGCRLIGKNGADRLVRALTGAQPQGRQPLCDAAGPTYRLTFDMPAARVIPIIVPTPCGPISVGDLRYRINDDAVRALKSEFSREAKYAEFIERCVGRESDAAEANAYLGKTEDELARLRTEQGVDIRVVGRDGTCLYRLSDRKSERVNVILVDDAVIWARRF